MIQKPDEDNEVIERFEGTPRSIRELAFAAGSRPCAHCGAYSELQWQHLDSPPFWRTTATCPKCGVTRVNLFHYTEDLTDVDPPELQLGVGPATVLEPHDFMGVIERVEPTITTPLVSFNDKTAQNWDRVERVQTALNELEKLVPEGASSIPASAFRSEAGRAHYAAHPGHYARMWIDVAIARYAALVDNCTPARPPPVVQSRGTIDRASLLAHREWYQTGKGTRLEVAGANAKEMKLDGSMIERGRFEGVDFTRADMNQADWSESELLGCKFINAKFNDAKLVGSTILDCIFETVAAATVDMSRTKISRSSFVRAGMPGSKWTDAVVSSTNFSGASFGNARWERARFVDCDFQGASLEPDREIPPTRMRGVVFEGCDFRNANFKGTDLRDATFKRCKLAGAHDEPKYFSELTLDDCDISLADLKKQLVLPAMSAAEIKTNPDYVIARDREDSSDTNIVFEVGKTGVRRVARTTEPPTAFTYGRTRFVWLPTDDTFSAWSHDGRRLVVTRSTNELWTPGTALRIADVTGIASFIDARHPGRRGVALITPSYKFSRLVFVQEQDMLAIENRDYTIADARRDGRWAAVLGRELAAWLGVPHDEMRTDLK